MTVMCHSLSLRQAVSLSIITYIKHYYVYIGKVVRIDSGLLLTDIFITLHA